MFKRLLLWSFTNIAVIAVITIILKITGLDQALGGSQGYLPMLLGAAVIGFAGSFISLLMSKSGAIRSMGVQLIESPSNETERWLVATVERQASTLGIGMPDVGIFNAPDPNAFATGANKNSALVAVSTGLLANMNRDEVEAVIGHEMSHVANGDMVTMTLLQGIVNTFVVFFARIIANVVASSMSRNGERSSGAIYFLVVMVLQVVFGFLATMITSAFSRYREYRADAGGAHLASRAKMIGALEALQRAHNPSSLPKEMDAFGISGSFSNLFSTHPPLEKRIEALRNSNNPVG